MFSLKVASVGGDRLLSSDAVIVPTISGNSFSDMIFRVTKTAHHPGELTEYLSLSFSGIGPRAQDAA